MIHRGIATMTLDTGSCPKWLFERSMGIPREPKILLGNYLLRLLENSDKKRSSIYLVGVSPIVQEMWEELVTKYRRTLKTRRLLPERLGMPLESWYPLKNGQKAIPIKVLDQFIAVWQDLCAKTAEEAQQKWQEIWNSDFSVKGSRGSAAMLPKYIDPELSYFIGWVCGDGNLENYRGHYLIKIGEKSTDQLRHVLQPLVQELFRVKPNIYHIYGGGYALQMGSKPIFRFLTKVLNLRVGEVPVFISTLDEVNKAHFLSGIFDAEGYVRQDSYQITISQAKREFLLAIADLARGLGVTFNGPVTHTSRLGTWYTIYIRRKSEIMRFAEQIGSHHVDKSHKLNAMVSKILSGHRI